MIAAYTGLYSLTLRTYTIVYSFSCILVQTQSNAAATQGAGTQPIYTVM